ncbi:MAG TPA: hypothetical protein VMT90_00680 [Dehalococcoidia bacterium]|nr:hypothetical protein [Dehalococcoidia bacterium]
MIARLFAFVAVISFATALIAGALSSLSAGSAEDGECSSHLCPGYVYQVLYDEDTGKVSAMLSWDPAVSDPMKLGTGFVPHPGQRTAIVHADDIADGTFQDPATDKYVFDASNGRILRVGEGRRGVEEGLLNWLTSVAASSAGIPVFSFTLGLVMSVAGFAFRRRTNLP